MAEGREMGLEGMLVVQIQALPVAGGVTRDRALASPDSYIVNIFNSNRGAVWKMNDTRKDPSAGAEYTVGVQ